MFGENAHTHTQLNKKGHIGTIFWFLLKDLTTLSMNNFRQIQQNTLCDYVIIILYLFKAYLLGVKARSRR